MLPENDSLVPKIVELSKESLDAFCDDISTMFEVEMSCQELERSVADLKAIKKQFKKLTAVHTVQAQGVLEGTFQLVFDQAGLFTLAGVIVMLPTQRILEEAKRGTLKDAQSIGDAVGEVGNLLIGTWDRVFRDDLEGHKHLLKSGTFLGDPWSDPSQVEGLADSEQFHVILYEITIESYPSFKCAAVLPLETRAAGDTPALVDEPATEAVEPVTDETAADAVVEEAVAEAEDASTEATAPEPAEPVAETPSATDEPSADAPETPASEPVPVEPEAVEPEAVEPEAVEPETAEPETAEPETTESATAESVQRPAPEIVTVPEAAPRPRALGLGTLMSTPARELMSAEVVWVDPQASVNEVLTAMQQHDVGYVLVGQTGSLQGLVSKSNVLGAMSPYLRPVFSKWRRPADDATMEIRVQWIMSRPVRTVRPEAPLAVVIEQMRQFGGRCLPVVAPDGMVQGLVTVFDILRVLTPDLDTSLLGRTPQAPCLMV